MSRQYQSETPSGTDLFDTKGHKRVAEAIANVLKKDPNLHIIGIEGPLGSGKSTVISILEQELHSEEFSLITFDADKYHSVIKSALIKKIKARLDEWHNAGSLEPDEQKKIEDAVNAALGKTLRYFKETNSHIPLLSVAFFVFLGLAGLMFKTALKFWFGVEPLPGKPPSISTIEGYIATGSLFLPLFPLIALLIKSFYKREFLLGDLLKRNSEDLINETLDINREVGPLELEEAFTCFSHSVPPGKTLILVIDNIDRVAPDIARELWSDIDILASLCGEKFRVLLPYSELHLAKALEKAEVEEKQSGKEFISKRIPVTFTVPPVVSTGWRDRFKEYWDETLPDVGDFAAVCNLIEIWQADVTPRYLKSLVNRIGAKIDTLPDEVSSQKCNPVPIGTACAAYILAIKDNGALLSELITNPGVLIADVDSTDRTKLILTQRVLTKAWGNNDWDKELVCIHYQAPYEKAAVELLDKPLREATASGNNEGVDIILEKKDIYGFDYVFRKIIDDEFTDVVQLVKLIAKLLDASHDNKSFVDRFLKDIEHKLKEFGPSLETFDSGLISAYETFKKHDLVVDSTIIQKGLKHETERLAIETEGFSIVGHGQTNGWSYKGAGAEVVTERALNIYQYCQLTETKPLFITEPTVNFVINVLTPIKDKLPDWDIDSLLANLAERDFVKVVQAACSRASVILDEQNAFPSIISKMSVGALVGIRENQLINIKTEILNRMPPDPATVMFTAEWHGINHSELCHSITVLFLDSAKKSVEDTELERLFALTVASFIKTFQPHEKLPGYIKTDSTKSISASNWLNSYATSRGISAEHLHDYLLFVPFKKTLLWMRDSSIGVWLDSTVDRFITEGRVSEFDGDNLMENYYSEIIRRCHNVTPNVLLKLAVPALKALNFASWEAAAIRDLLLQNDAEFDELKHKVVSHFDIGVSKSEWQNTFNSLAQHGEEIYQLIHGNNRAFSKSEQIEQEPPFVA